MRAPGLRLVHAEHEHLDADARWLEWLTSHIDRKWRPGEWDEVLWLFTGDLDNLRTAAWRCRTPGCPTPTHRQTRRCDTCRRDLAESRLSEEAFDARPRARRRRPTTPGACSVAGCKGEMLCRGLCFSHERSWRRSGVALEDFIATARPLARRGTCVVAGCGREHVSSRGLCHFHDERLGRRHGLGLSAEELAAWVAAERPRLSANQFSMASLSGLVRYELLYALQRRDEMPPPLDPLQVGILIRRLEGPVPFAAPTLRRCAKWAACNTTRSSAGCSRTFGATSSGHGWPMSAPTPMPATSGKWACSTCSRTARDAGRPAKVSSISGTSSFVGCAR